MAMLLEFSMAPLGRGESVGEYVADCLQIIEASGLPYRLNPMGTVLEGDFDELMGVVRDCLNRMSTRSDRITCTIKFDWRQGATGRLTSKIESVEKRLGRKLNQ